MEYIEAQGLLLERRTLGDRVEMLSVLTAQHGIVHGAAPQQVKTHWPVGSVLYTTYQQRVPTQVGRFSVQLLHPYAAYALLSGRAAVAGVQLVCDLLAHYMPERAPLAATLYQQTIALVHGHAAAAPHIAHTHALWEKELLQQLGYIANTDQCYSAGCAAPTVYLSPRTARGACLAHGALWKERLLPYPQLWRTRDVNEDTIAQLERVLPLLWQFVPHVRRSAVQISRQCYIAALRNALAPQ